MIWEIVIKLNFLIYIEPAINLLTESAKPIYDMNNGERVFQMAIKISYDYRWENGLKFMDIISQRLPSLITNFINNDQFQEKMKLIIVNNNKEFLHAKKENKEFNHFFNKIVGQLNKEQFSELYQKNDLFINSNNTPNLRKILDNYHLQNEMSINEDNPNKRKNKI